MKELIFIATTKKLTQKYLRISNYFVIIFVWIGSSLFRQTLKLQWYLYIKVSLILHTQMQYGFKLARWRSEMYPCTPCRINNMLLASCNVCNIKMWLRRQFFSHWKDKTLQTFKNKQSKLDELTGMINFGEFPLTSISLTSIQYVYYLYDDNKSGSSVNELRCRMFTKKNSSRDRLPSNSDALVLHLCREH